MGTAHLDKGPGCKGQRLEPSLNLLELGSAGLWWEIRKCIRHSQLAVTLSLVCDHLENPWEACLQVNMSLCL